ncbi:Hsp70 family protein [Rhodococcus sp. NPDC049939]|uniref:Hsp70 family protein n=1 Tax=Rhodococcus sp. NPDC049939 TaxID=3155511 RepID=UPI0033C526D2
MSSVLGVSVGASAVRLTCRGLGADALKVDAGLAEPEELAAESIGTLLAEKADEEPVQAIGIAYQDQAQAGAIRSALARQRIDNFRLVPEVSAALTKLEMSGVLGGYSTLLFYDMGSSGLTITVVDRSTRMALGTARTDEISGNLIDHLIRDSQLALHHIDQPTDDAAVRALDIQCRDAKEELSTGGSACMPGDGGLLVLSRGTFESLIEGPVEKSMRLVRSVIDRSGRTPHAVVLIGGGAHIPLVRSTMESELGIPVIVPEQPELVAAEGAALLAESESGSGPLPFADESSARAIADNNAKPLLSGPVLVGGLAVIALVGLGLGVGANLGSSSDQSPPAVVPQPNLPNSLAPVAGIPPVESPEELPAPPTQPAAATTTQSAPLLPAVQPAVPTEEEVPAPIQAPAPIAPEQGPADEGAVVPPPEPPPAPAPAPLIPGLPQIPLPVLELPGIQFPPPPPPPELPQFPGP